MHAPPDRLDRVDAAGLRRLLSPLCALLQDAVHDGASVGFLAPLSRDAAEAYWLGLGDELARGDRLLLVAHAGHEVAGAAQLLLCRKENGRHRAEVQKVLVHTRHRRRGLARRLMQALEAEAEAAGIRLLYLDTEPGKPAERLYVGHGYVLAGHIPDYARTPDGCLHATALYFKRLSPEPPAP